MSSYYVSLCILTEVSGFTLVLWSSVCAALGEVQGIAPLSSVGWWREAPWSLEGRRSRYREAYWLVTAPTYACPYVCLSVHSFVCLIICLYMCLSVCPSIRLSVRLFVYVSVCLAGDD